MSSTCAESIGKSCTTTIINTPGGYLHELKIPDVLQRKITLVQEPQETFIFDFKLKKDSEISKFVNSISAKENTLATPCCVYTYDLTLMFENKLHEISMDYGYVIECKALIDDNGIKRHISLSSHKVMRTSKTIFVQFEVLYLTKFDRLKLIHACFSFERFKNTGRAMEESINISGNQICSLLLNEEFKTDFSLLVGDKTIRTHKSVLSLKSHVFRAMFTHDMLENQLGTLEIKGFKPQVIEEMLNFIYTNQIRDLKAVVTELLVVAHIYGLDELVSICEEHLLFNMNVITVSRVLEIANTYNLESLMISVRKFIDIYEKEVVREDTFKEYLCRTLRIDTLLYTLKLCGKYRLIDVKFNAFKYVKENSKTLVDNEDFLNLFDSHPALMKDLFKYIHS